MCRGSDGCGRSFGSQISWQPLAFDRLGRATGALGAQLVISAGELARTPFRTSMPAHVLVVEYAPQRSLLKQAGVMVTHGGANSVMEALFEGVPLLVSPVCNDQPLQARFIERAGVGIRLCVHTADVRDTTLALAELLTRQNSARGAAASIRASYAKQDGAAHVAERLLQLAVTPTTNPRASS